MSRHPCREMRVNPGTLFNVVERLALLCPPSLLRLPCLQPAWHHDLHVLLMLAAADRGRRAEGHRRALALGSWADVAEVEGLEPGLSPAFVTNLLLRSRILRHLKDFPCTVSSTCCLARLRPPHCVKPLI